MQRSRLHTASQHVGREATVAEQSRLPLLMCLGLVINDIGQGRAALARADLRIDGKPVSVLCQDAQRPHLQLRLIVHIFELHRLQLLLQLLHLCHQALYLLLCAADQCCRSMMAAPSLEGIAGCPAVLSASQRDQAPATEERRRSEGPVQPRVCVDSMIRPGGMLGVHAENPKRTLRRSTNRCWFLRRRASHPGGLAPRGEWGAAILTCPPDSTRFGYSCSSVHPPFRHPYDRGS